MATVENRLHDYKEKIKVDGEELVRNVFPKRVFEMEEILTTGPFTSSPDSVYSEVNIPCPTSWPPKGANSLGDGIPSQNAISGNTQDRMAVEKPFATRSAVFLPNGPVPYNHQIKGMIEKTKPCLTQLMMEAQLVRLWVQYNIPRIEDGNNFGVGIQEEVLSEASGIERDACTFLDQITRYFASRGKLIGKVAKFPHIDDYRECIRDMDEKQAITMRYIIMEIRNHYATLHDIILKNIDRIKMPRSNNAITMY